VRVEGVSRWKGDMYCKWGGGGGGCIAHLTG
jgi:hypothetical protein